MKHKDNIPKLTIKQQKFANAYVNCGNASQAYREAYSCENMKPTTVNRKAIELLNNGKITACIEKIQDDIKKSSDITRDEILSTLAAIIRVDIPDYFKDRKFKDFEELTPDQRKAIAEIKIHKGNLDFKLNNRLEALKIVNRMLGYEAPRDFNIDLKNFSESALDAIIERLIIKSTDAKN